MSAATPAEPIEIALIKTRLEPLRHFKIQRDASLLGRRFEATAQILANTQIRLDDIRAS